MEAGAQLIEKRPIVPIPALNHNVSILMQYGLYSALMI